MKKYIILRDLNRASATSGTRGISQADFSFKGTRSLEGGGGNDITSGQGSGGGSIHSGGGFEGFIPDDLPAPAVETASLSPKDVDDATRDPAVAGFGEVMPTILLAPVAADGEAEAAVAPTPNWGVAAIGADASPFTGRNVRVAVLDTGIDATHAAFMGMSLACRDFTTGVAGGTALAAPDAGWDGDGHGTHCAGTIFGRDVGGARIGVARGVTRALIGKALDDRGSGTTEMLFQALQWAIAESVDVVSMSIGFDFPGLVERRIALGWKPRQAASDALVAYGSNLRLFDAMMAMVRTRAVFNEGTVIVAASGNESDRSRDIRIAASVPAAAEGVLSVGALGEKGGRFETAFFSNTAPLLCAPGVRIPSAKPGGGIAVKSGTSMACPHVAGAAALWWEALREASPNGKASAEEVAMRLRASARKGGIFTAFSKFDHGAGLVTAPDGMA